MKKVLAITWFAFLVVFNLSTLSMADDSDSLIVDDSGNVGIGVAAPTSRLEVNGHIKLSNSDPYVLVDSDAKHLVLSGGNGWANHASTIVLRGKDTNYNPHGIEMYTGGQERLRIFSDGVVDINGNIRLSSPDPYLYVIDDTRHLVLSGGNGWVNTAATLVLRGKNANYNPHGIEIYTGELERLRVTASGNVGIGTPTPVARLQILSPASDVATVSNANLYLRGSNQGYGVAMGTMLNYPGGAWMQGTVNDGVDAINLLLNPSGGNVGIGTANPQFKLDVQGGSIRVDGTTYTSDIRWKENIQSINDALELVSQLRGISYEWIDKSHGDGIQLGVIAQEVEAIFPEVVHTDNQGYKSVEYAKLVAPLIEAVKELKAQNEQLKNQLNQQKDGFEQRLAAIEAQLHKE